MLWLRRWGGRLIEGLLEGLGHPTNWSFAIGSEAARNRDLVRRILFDQYVWLVRRPSRMTWQLTTAEFGEKPIHGRLQDDFHQDP